MLGFWTQSVPRIVMVLLPIVWASVSMAGDESPQGTASGEPRGAISGREIFQREWLPNDPRSHGGDGLGPVFNDTSCVACHNQGGVGGGGAESKNVTVISAVRNPTPEELRAPRSARGR